MQVLLQFVILKQFHHPDSIHLFLLIERNEFELLRILGNILERTFN